MFGHVVLAGKPAGGVTVTLGLPSRPDLVTVTDEHGRYAIRGLPPGEYFVKPLLTGHAIVGDLEYQRLRLADGDPPQEVNFALAPASAIEGRVLDSAGQPIANAPVYLVKLTARDVLLQGRVIPVVRTDAHGSYRFADVQPGRYRIAVKPYHDPMAPLESRTALSDVEYYYRSANSTSAATTLVVAADRPLTGIDVHCEDAVRGLTAAGHVVDTAAGAPVPHAALIYGAIDATGTATVRSGAGIETADTGQFTITGLAPGRYWVGLLNSKSGASFGRPVFFDISSSNVAGLEIPVERGMQLPGQVVISGIGMPADRVRFTVTFVPLQISTGIRTRGDAINVAFSKTVPVGPDGRFLLDGVPPGRGRVRLRMGSASYSARVRQNGLDAPGGEVAANAGAGPIEIIVSAGTGQIRGYLRSTAQRFDTTNLEVVAFLQQEDGSFSRRAPVNPNGRFVLDNLPPGEYRVMAIAWSTTGTESRIGPVVSLRLEPGAAPEIEIDIRMR